MHYVYLLRSESEPLQRYIGLTDDLRARLAHLNSGAYPHMPAKRHYFPVPKYPEVKGRAVWQGSLIQDLTETSIKKKLSNVNTIRREP